jgi:two-component sensor histidine kinase/ABC-type amino acid transport substrate-binding protein
MIASHWPPVLLLAACLATAGGAGAASRTDDPLTREERDWLAAHPVIRIAYEPNYAPLTFADAKGQIQGISVDYVHLLEKKLGIRFQVVEPGDLAANLDRARKGKIDVLTSVMRTPERATYLLFTAPYQIVPASIIVKKERKGTLTLDQMLGMKIAVVDGYAVQTYLQSRSPALQLVPADHELACLRMLSFGEVDAAVLDMASAVHLIQTEGIGNLRVAGESGFTYRLSLASRKDWPLLNSILKKGMAAISPREAETIQQNWIQLERKPVLSKPVWIGILTTVTLIILGIVGVMLWNRSLVRMVAKRSQELTAELAERRRAEEAVHQALMEKETLIRELYHRTKNNLQIVSSLMHIRAGKAGPETRALVQKMDNLIRGLSLIHQMLHQSGNLSNLDLTEYLDSLTRLAARNFWEDPSQVTIDFQGEAFPVTLDIASPCGLVINELLSNTFKHAFPDGRHGHISIRVRRDGPKHLVLEYADNGVGLPEGFDPRSPKTLGLQSILAIVEQQLSGEASIAKADGLHFILRIATSHYQERV